MSNSPLVTYTNLTTHRTSPRNHAIDTITIHCYVGQVTAQQGCDYFAVTTRDASANYVVGHDGSIGLSVNESDRAWTSSNAANDHRAITIETACDTFPPYAVTGKAYNALIELCADICRRNGIKQLLWKGDKALVGQADKQNMTVHRWFAATACPGDWLYARMGEIAEKVNTKLKEEDDDMTGEEIYKKLNEYLDAQPVPDWAKAEFQEAIDAGITDGNSPMQMIPRYQAAIMAKRAKLD